MPPPADFVRIGGVDKAKFDEVVLAMLWHNLREAGAAWKSFDWESTGRLFEAGLISKPASKAKSVRLSEEGFIKAEAAFRKHFGDPQTAGPASDNPMNASRAAPTRAEVVKEVKAFLALRRPPMELRSKADLGFRYHDRTVELLELRWRDSTKTEHPFAKATFVGTVGRWKVWWKGGSGWIPYEPLWAKSLKTFLALVHEDRKHCFFG